MQTRWHDVDILQHSRFKMASPQKQAHVVEKLFSNFNLSTCTSLGLVKRRPSELVPPLLNTTPPGSQCLDVFIVHRPPLRNNRSSVEPRLELVVLRPRAHYHYNHVTAATERTNPALLAQGMS
ncbi:hypothetical protein TNCV_68961 [Trichonephila clavipes]|nr:hypothetical protein TNCV_68961 [Trichonephila clavipes]